MEITDIKVRIVHCSSKIKAIASITIDDCFAIHDIKVVEGASGLFVGMPARRGEDGVFRDIVHPIETETRQRITELILNEYRETLKREQEAEKEGL